MGRNKKKVLEEEDPEADLSASKKKKKEVEVASAPAPAQATSSAPSEQQQPPTPMEVEAPKNEPEYPPSFVIDLPQDPSCTWTEMLQAVLKRNFPGGWRKLEVVEAGSTAAVWLKSWADYKLHAALMKSKRIENGTMMPGYKGLAEWTPPPKVRRIRKRPQKFLIRGLPWLLQPKELENHLRTKGLKTAVELHQKTDRSRPPLFIIYAWRGDGEDAAPPSSILSMTRILGITVKTSKLPPNMELPPQCYRCQAFGHIAKHCRAAEVCVACGGPHRKAACTLKKADPPRCHNCGGPHVASWKGCKAFLRAQQRARNERKKTHVTEQPTAPRRPRGGRQGAAPAGGPQSAARSASRRSHEMAGASAQGSAPATPTTRSSRRGGHRARQRGANQSARGGHRGQQGAAAAARSQRAAIDPAIQAAIDAAVQRAVTAAVQAAVEAAMKNVLPLLSIQSNP